MTIETTRLLLRPFQVEDATGMFLLNTDPEVIKYTGDLPFDTIDHTREFITHYQNYEQHGYGRMSVFLKSSNDYLGWCGLSYHESSKETDIGFRFLQNYWNKGYATEAADACLNYGFQLGLDKIIGRVVKENAASIQVLKKVGMKFEREFFAHEFICEQYYIKSNDQD